MNKGDLVDAVAAELDESKAHATRAVDVILSTIQRGVQSDGRVTISGFGSFERRERAARMGVNPSTKQPMEIKASTTVAFKPAQALKESLEPVVVPS